MNFRDFFYYDNPEYSSGFFLSISEENINKFYGSPVITTKYT